MAELKLFAAAEHTDLMLVASEENILDMTALIVGPGGTPYAGGFFVFSFRIPSDFPFSPPAMQIQTTDGGRVRFNPNLYAGGKVCVTILNTFGAKEWSSMLRFEAVLRTVQSMMTEDPYHNEPGFEKCVATKEAKGALMGFFDWVVGGNATAAAPCRAYAAKITHEVIRVAVCVAVDAAVAMLNGTPPPLRKVPTPGARNQKRGRTDDAGVSTAPLLATPAWATRIVTTFNADVETHLATCDKMAPAFPDGTPFTRCPFEGGGNDCAGHFSWAQLKVQLSELRAVAKKVKFPATSSSS
jgi:ubiquitin-conjugating enzyme E2 Z